MELSPGMAVLAMVLDTLSGRSPLYRLSEFFEEKGTGLLLGSDIGPNTFATTTQGARWIRINRNKSVYP
jgi:myo-inositol-hexaphosphate 3-phosphohydrolase